MIALAEGLSVRYKHFTGRIQFISEKYLTLCINQFEQRERDVCILIYRSDWEKIILLKQSDK